MNALYRWPVGTFEPLGAPWLVIRYRPMPCTPAGDVIAEFETKEQADAAVDQLCAARPSLSQAKDLARSLPGFKELA